MDLVSLAGISSEQDFRLLELAHRMHAAARYGYEVVTLGLVEMRSSDSAGSSGKPSPGAEVPGLLEK